MTLLGEPATRLGAFGAGGAEPYDHALRSGDSGPIFLRGGERDAEVDLDRWRGDADAADLRMLARVDGPVLDVGCGPGRMVAAGRDLGLEAWGLDISAAAVAHARARGIPALVGSVFDRLPIERAWATILLVDGNVGIGGDVAQLLARCRRLLAPRGLVVAELHPDDERDARFAGRLVDLAGRESADFPWAEIGLAALVPVAERAGLEVAADWEDSGRVFCALRPTGRIQDGMPGSAPTERARESAPESGPAPRRAARPTER